ncbi:MAG TPA: hypothetical protein PKM50_02345 [Methanoregula sp.]|nr:hypothetical protein [Methanoregula sp.]
MKKIVLLALGICMLFSCAAAYQVFIYAPDTLTIGKPLVVNGTTTFGIGTPIDVVLYRQVTTSTEVKRKIAYVQSDRTFRVVFDTTYLEKGLYKIEVPSSSTGESISMRQVRLIDRSDELTMTSQMNQPLSGKMYIDGKISGNSNAGVQIAVIAPDNSVIYGPIYVSTDYFGGFDIIVPVSQPGDYVVTFTDEQGYIDSRIISIIGGLATTVVPKTTVTITNTVVLSAHGRTSRNDPVYFIVKPANNAPVTISTSSSVDWVVEYVDANGDLHTINDQSDVMAEEIVVNGEGKPLYFKIYPYKYSVSSDVYLYAQNAESVSVSETVPAVFTVSATSMPVQTETQNSPLTVTGSIVAACIAALLFSLRWHK